MKRAPRVAWLLPSMARGYYWHPVLAEFARAIPQTVVYTGLWTGYLAGFQDRFKVEVVGRTRYWAFGSGFILPPLSILPRLFRFRPQVVFTVGFSVWSGLCIALKSWLGCRVVIVYDGSSAAVDMLGSRFRLFTRRVLARHSDALITNSKGGKAYLTGVLGVQAERVLARPYEVPCLAAMTHLQQSGQPPAAGLRHPVFAAIGRLIRAKGLHLLLQACATLRGRGLDDYSLLIIGDGPQRQALERLVVELGLKCGIHWTGWLDYTRLGECLARADVLVFPTLADTWGMAVLEAMAFGKAVLCSKWAGAAEMVAVGDNGYLFDPHQPEQLAGLMEMFLVDPALAKAMGARSRKLIESHSPVAAANFFEQVVARVLQV